MTAASIPYFGEILSLIAALFWATAIILFKQVGDRLGPVALNTFKNVFSILWLPPTIWLFGGSQWPADVPMVDVWLLILSGVLGMGLSDTFYLMALNRLGAAAWAIVNTLYAPLVVLMAVFWLGESLTVWQIIGVVMVVTAVTLVGGEGQKKRRHPWKAAVEMLRRPMRSGSLRGGDTGEGDDRTDDESRARPGPLRGGDTGEGGDDRTGDIPALASKHGPVGRQGDDTGEGDARTGVPTRAELLAGIALALLAMTCMAVSIIMAKPVLDRTPVIWANEVRLGGGILVLLVIIFARRRPLAIFKPLADPYVYKRMVPGAFIGTYLALMLLIAGLKFAQASTATVLNQTSNLFIFVLAVIFLKEPATPKRWIGVALGVGGAMLVMLARGG